MPTSSLFSAGQGWWRPIPWASQLLYFSTFDSLCGQWLKRFLSFWLDPDLYSSLKNKGKVNDGQGKAPFTENGKEERRARGSHPKEALTGQPSTSHLQESGEGIGQQEDETKGEELIGPKQTHSIGHFTRDQSSLTSHHFCVWVTSIFVVEGCPVHCKM